MVDLALQVGLSRVVGCRQHMHGLTIPQHATEHPAKSKEDLLVGVLRAGLAFLPASSCHLGVENWRSGVTAEMCHRQKEQGHRRYYIEW